MNEKLSEMVKEGPREEENFALSEELEFTENTSEESQTEIPQRDSIEIVSLAEWFDENVSNFPSITKPTITVRGVNPNEQLIITIPIQEGDQERRKLVVFDDANILPVLNIPAMDMQIYNNGFRIVYELGGTTFIKSYGIRTGLISVFCHDIFDHLVPYGIVKSKKKDTEISILGKPVSEVQEKLEQQLDFEALQIRYKQSSKAEGLQTNWDAIVWLLERQGMIEDINHHLQIDNVIINTLA